MLDTKTWSKYLFNKLLCHDLWRIGDVNSGFIYRTRFNAADEFPILSSVLYLAVFGTVIGFSAYFSLVGRIGAAKAAYSTLLFPLVALTVSTFFEGYEWTLNAVFGILLILLGNYLMFSKFEIGKKLFSSQKL